MDKVSFCIVRTPARWLIILLIVGAAHFSVPFGDGQTISGTGGWNFEITEADLSGPGGSALQNSYESPPETGSISVSNTSGGWFVSVRRTLGNWPAGVSLWVRRSSSGTYSEGETIAGGLSYQEVTDEGAVLFEGNGDGSGIGLDYRVTGVSVDDAADIYDAAANFSITAQ